MKTRNQIQLEVKQRAPEPKAKWVPVTVKVPRDILCVAQTFAEIEGVTFDQYVARALATVATDTDDVTRLLMQRQDSAMSGEFAVPK